jgi:hypothetical protein
MLKRYPWGGGFEIWASTSTLGHLVNTFPSAEPVVSVTGRPA